MIENNPLIGILKKLTVGKSLTVGKTVYSTMEANSKTCSCYYCTFGARVKPSANGCIMREACMAHLRPDRQSVLFKSNVLEDNHR